MIALTTKLSVLMISISIKEIKLHLNTIIDQSHQTGKHLKSEYGIYFDTKTKMEIKNLDAKGNIYF